jgi:hypothetical protein
MGEQGGARCGQRPTLRPGPVGAHAGNGAGHDALDPSLTPWPADRGYAVRGSCVVAGEGEQRHAPTGPGPPTRMSWVRDDAAMVCIPGRQDSGGLLLSYPDDHGVTSRPTGSKRRFRKRAFLSMAAQAGTTRISDVFAGTKRSDPSHSVGSKK